MIFNKNMFCIAQISLKALGCRLRNEDKKPTLKTFLDNPVVKLLLKF